MAFYSLPRKLDFSSDNSSFFLLIHSSLLLCFSSHKTNSTRKALINNVKFKSLYEKAKLVDDLVDNYMKTKGINFVPRSNLEQIVTSALPNAGLVNFGLHKLVFYLRHKTHELVLKTGKAQDIELEHKAYKQLPADLRHVYFAKIFWHTKYCLLQEYGIEAVASAEALAQLREVANKYGLLDITCDNIRNINGYLKIIDASIAPPGFFKLWKTADAIKLRLPTPVRKAIRKSRMLTIDKK